MTTINQLSFITRQIAISFVIAAFAFAPATQAFATTPEETPEVVSGCMDPEADNFNSEATVDDDSCEFDQGENEDEDNDKKIKVCHQTEAEDGHYNLLMVSKESIGGHTSDKGDIIAPFEGDDDDENFLGLNWDEEGIAIYNNDCVVPSDDTDDSDHGTIVIKKVVSGLETDQLFSFNLSWDGEGTQLADGGTYTSEDLDEGEYSVSEDVPEGWNQPEVACVSSNEEDTEVASEINLSEGETVTCTFTNTPVEVINTPSICKNGSNLLQNASFEDPVAPTNSWNIFPTVANWIISSTGLEIWNKFNGSGVGTPSAGDQNAELDGNESTTISQVVTTVPGATYELRYDFSPRAGTSLATNAVDAKADGVTLDSFSADGTTNTDNVWTTRTATFVASTGATTISFEDKGTSDSYGSLIDNTALCLVSLPEVKSCSVTAVSDTSNNVVETSAAAKLLSPINAGWTALIADASWIWSDDQVVDTSVDNTQTFTKTFNWNGPVTATQLDIAADNSYEVTLNGNPVGSDADEFNYTLAGQDSITGFNAAVVQGVNTLTIKVTNKGIAESNSIDNPAGLLYKLVVTGSDANCGSVVIDEGGGDDETPTDNNNSSTGGGGGGGKRISLSSRNGGEVLGASDTAGEVKGAVAPAGAPNTGAGGTSPATHPLVLSIALLGLVAGIRTARRAAL